MKDISCLWTSDYSVVEEGGHLQSGSRGTDGGKWVEMAEVNGLLTGSAVEGREGLLFTGWYLCARHCAVCFHTRCLEHSQLCAELSFSLDRLPLCSPS